MTADRGWVGPAVGWGCVGAAVQLAFALLGHWVEPVASWFGVLGPVTALAIGLLFAYSFRPGFVRAAAGGLGGLLGRLVARPVPRGP